MKLIKIGFFTVILWSATHAYADVLSVFGFEFGKSIELPECSFKLVGNSKMKMYEVLPSVTCIQEAHALNGYGQPIRRIVFARGEAPAIVKNFTIFPLEVGGILVGLNFLTPGLAAQDVVLAELTRKFGSPAKFEKLTAKNLMGASFDTFESKWVAADDVSVVFTGVTTRVETGEVFIDTAAARSLRAGWQKNSAANERPL